MFPIILEENNTLSLWSLLSCELEEIHNDNVTKKLINPKLLLQIKK